MAYTFREQVRRENGVPVENLLATASSDANYIHSNFNYNNNKEHLETCRKSSGTSDRPERSTALFFMPISSWIIA